MLHQFQSYNSIQPYPKWLALSTTFRLQVQFILCLCIVFFHLNRHQVVFCLKIFRSLLKRTSKVFNFRKFQKKAEDFSLSFYLIVRCQRNNYLDTEISGTVYW